jgi:hypothetical protein
MGIQIVLEQAKQHNQGFKERKRIDYKKEDQNCQQ